MTTQEKLIIALSAYSTNARFTLDQWFEAKAWVKAHPEKLKEITRRFQ